MSYRTVPVRNNGFNPVWDEHLSVPFDLVGDMLDLVFVRFAVKRDGSDLEEPLAVYCASLGSLNMGKEKNFMLHMDPYLTDGLYRVPTSAPA